MSLTLLSEKDQTSHHDNIINVWVLHQFLTLLSVSKAAGAKESLPFVLKSCSLSTTCILHKLVQRGI